MSDAVFLPKVVLVTGGAGFIGANFVRFVMANCGETRVVNLDCLTYAGNLENLADVANDPRYAFAKVDICDTKNVLGVCREHKVDSIVHFAAESHVDRSITGPDPFIRTNVSGTLSLLDVARMCDGLRFVQVGTDEVYGSLGPTGRFTEDTPLDPHSPYSASKAAADHLASAFWHTHGLPVLITRSSNNYGPYQFPEKMIPLMVNNARRDKALPVYGDGLNVRDWLYVEDHCRALWTVLTRGQAGRVYNIGGDSERTNVDLVKAILRHLGKPESLISFVRDRPGHDRRYAIDASRIHNELGWTPSMGFQTGLARTIDWYLAHEAWLDHVTSGAYQEYYEQMYAGR
ncbi:MAG: dTDP-glucose 4,6-dehydratase [Phycisphaerae bacterium]|nr:dTDP-glucose 4,6-dehydratase [Phycisphaerae bacterium]